MSNRPTKVLSGEENKIIEDKGTEAPFSGIYDAFFEDGNYSCKRCGEKLYSSKSKFDSGCGWPSFDAEYEGSIKRSVDVDGRRTEITCSGCGAHLGHVFEGEGYTPKDTHHCVNSISLEFEEV